MIPLGDSTRRPIQFPVITLTIIAMNAFIFILELLGGEAFINRWAFVLADRRFAQALAGSPHNLSSWRFGR